MTLREAAQALLVAEAGRHLGTIQAGRAIDKALTNLRAALVSEEGAGRGERFRVEGKGVIDTEGGLDRCTGCGHLPPHAGCKAICAACAPPTGACYCVGCAIHAQGYRAGTAAQRAECLEIIRAHRSDDGVADCIEADLLACTQPAPSTPAPATAGYGQPGGSCSCGRFLWTLGAPTFLDKEGIEHSKGRCAAPAPVEEPRAEEALPRCADCAHFTAHATPPESDRWSDGICSYLTSPTTNAGLCSTFTRRAPVESSTDGMGGGK